MGITCSVCHDPHDATYEGRLRFPVVEATTETHLWSTRPRTWGSRRGGWGSRG